MKTLIKDWKYGKDIGILIFRLIFGIVLLYGHGSEKLSVIFSGQEIQFFDPIGIGDNLSFYLAGFAEGICAIFLIIGLFVRPAAIILSINFLVILSHHIGINDGFVILEPRFFYFFAFVALSFTGAGAFSLDRFLLKKKFGV